MPRLCLVILLSLSSIAANRHTQNNDADQHGKDAAEADQSQGQEKRRAGPPPSRRGGRGGIRRPGEGAGESTNAEVREPRSFGGVGYRRDAGGGRFRRVLADARIYGLQLDGAPRSPHGRDWTILIMDTNFVLFQATAATQFQALWAIVRKDWKQYWRYPLNAVSTVFQPVIWLAPVCRLASKNPMVARFFDAFLRLGKIPFITKLYKVYYGFPGSEGYRILYSFLQSELYPRIYTSFEQVGGFPSICGLNRTVLSMCRQEPPSDGLWPDGVSFRACHPQL